MQHGEFPDSLTSKVWWILIGTNDLARGGCSEEATVLGILRVAEEIHFRRPGDVVVIQGILPRSNRPDGALIHRSSIHSLFERTHSREYAVKMAQKQFNLWPSIVNINAELESFCAKHEHMVFFDASNLFLGIPSNANYNGKQEEIIQELMGDYVHPTAKGMEVMGNAIAKELNRIINEGNEENDVEIRRE
jgi:lysophospholipase L1-like esterase